MHVISDNQSGLHIVYDRAGGSRIGVMYRCFDKVIVEPAIGNRKRLITESIVKAVGYLHKLLKNYGHELTK